MKVLGNYNTWKCPCCNKCNTVDSNVNKYYHCQFCGIGIDVYFQEGEKAERGEEFRKDMIIELDNFIEEVQRIFREKEAKDDEL